MIGNASLTPLETDDIIASMKTTPAQSGTAPSGTFHVSRRQFIRAGAVGAAALSFPYVGHVLGANDRINVGCIGVAGKGDSDTDDTARLRRQSRRALRRG